LSAKQTLNEVFHKIFDLNVSSCNKQSFAQQEIDSRSSAKSSPSLDKKTRRKAGSRAHKVIRQLLI
jgi:hypothetical protein